MAKEVTLECHLMTFPKEKKPLLVLVRINGVHVSRQSVKRCQLGMKLINRAKWDT